PTASMYESSLRPGASRAFADSTSREQSTMEGIEVGRTLICRACLVLLGPEDVSHNLASEGDLAEKYFNCTGGDAGKELRLKRDKHEEADEEDEEDVRQLVLKSICECCYQLVQKFYDFQRMCEESSRNFEKLLLEMDLHCTQQQDADYLDWDLDLDLISDNPLDSKQELQMACMEEETVQEIVSFACCSKLKGFIPIHASQEEVLIIEDKDALQDLGRERVPLLTRRSRTGQRKRGVRHTLDCSRCERGFYKASLLEAHIKKQHEGLSPHTCVLCGKAYARANLLSAHLRTMHQPRKTHPCPSCDKVYTASRSLKYHMTRHHGLGDGRPSHGDDDARHVCEKCGKTFGRRAHLTRHMWIHTKLEDRQFECEICEQRFYTKQNLVDHLQRKHAGSENAPKCRKCGRILKNSLQLAEHMRKHNDQREDR
ncbi:hypothetical protein KR018_001883, partial [Drosophila ironensis]